MFFGKNLKTPKQGEDESGLLSTDLSERIERKSDVWSI
jgi:hypothetical protein